MKLRSGRQIGKEPLEDGEDNTGYCSFIGYGLTVFAIVMSSRFLAQALLSGV
jgi:hypothetical protein